MATINLSNIQTTIEQVIQYFSSLQTYSTEFSSIEFSDTSITSNELKECIEKNKKNIQMNTNLITKGEETVEILKQLMTTVTSSIEACKTEQSILKQTDEILTNKLEALNNQEQNEKKEEINEIEDEDEITQFELPSFGYEEEGDILGNKVEVAVNESLFTSMNDGTSEIPKMKFQMSKEQVQYLEELSGHQFEKVIFDNSDRNINWKPGKSDFSKIVLNKQHLIFLFLDNMNDFIFGAYIDAKIDEIDKYIDDPNAFVFSFKNESLAHYLINKKDSSKAVIIHNDDANELLTIGEGDIEVDKRLDRRVNKKMKQTSFNYENEINGLYMTNEYRAKQIVVIQMKEIDHEKEEKREEQWIKMVSEMTGMKYEETIYDSTTDGWSETNSTFDEKVKGKERIGILVEDSKRNVFGVFIKHQVDNICYMENSQWKGTSVNDPHAFVFNLQRNGKINKIITKYHIKRACSKWALQVYPQSHGVLFSVGGGNDICIRKEEYKSYCFCQQHSFDYNFDEAVLNGCEGMRQQFTAKRILVYQMSESEERLAQKEATRKTFINGVEKLGEKHYVQTIFDSFVDPWNIRDSSFDEKILNKQNIAIVVSDVEQNVFGIYLHDKIEKEEDGDEYSPIEVKDPEAFVFTIRSNERFNEPMKFTLKDKKDVAMTLYCKSANHLFTVGDHDIIVYKKSLSDKCYCKQTSFDYNKNRNALVGKEGKLSTFTVNRIQVWQMSDTEVQIGSSKVTSFGASKQVKKQRMRRPVRKPQGKVQLTLKLQSSFLVQSTSDLNKAFFNNSIQTCEQPKDSEEKVLTNEEKSEIEKQLKQKQNEIDELKEKVNEYQSKIEQSMNETKQQEKKIEKLEQELEEKNQEVKEVKDQLKKEKRKSQMPLEDFDEEIKPKKEKRKSQIELEDFEEETKPKKDKRKSQKIEDDDDIDIDIDNYDFDKGRKDREESKRKQREKEMNEEREKKSQERERRRKEREAEREAELEKQIQLEKKEEERKKKRRSYVDDENEIENEEETSMKKKKTITERKTSPAVVEENEDDSVSPIVHVPIEKDDKFMLSPQTIHSLTKMRVDDVIFDSNVHNWKKRTSEFEPKLKNKENVLIIVESDKGIIFGGFVKARIQTATSSKVTDSDCFVFSTKDDVLKKFMIKSIRKREAFTLPLRTHDTLFSFGDEIDVHKQGAIRKSKISDKQDIFDYCGEDKAILGIYGEFETKRIVAIQLK